MGNTLDMTKIKEDHQARSERLMQASAHHMATAKHYTDETMLACYADMLKELALIWREEANRLSELPSPKPRGWKTTMDSLRDCATRVSGVAVAMENHGLPDPGDSGPKETRTIAGASTPVNGAQAAALPAAGDQLDQAQTTGESSATEKLTDAGPKASASPSTDTPVSGADGSTLATPQAAPPHPSDDPAGDFLRDLGHAPNGLVDKVHEESLAEAASAIIEQERAGFEHGIKGPVTITYDKPSGEVYMSSGGAVDTSGPALMQLSWSIGAADAPPAWAAQPPVPVFELDSPMALDSPGHTSVSQANLAAECPLKWKLRYRHGAPDTPSWALVGGKAVHACIETIEQYPNQEQWAVADLWKQHFAHAIAQTEAENPLFPKATWHASRQGKENEAWWNADGPEMVHHYLEWRAKWLADGWELLKTATGAPVIELEFLWFSRAGMTKGFIDSAWYHPGRNMIAIVDWKSGSTKPADYFQQATYRHALEPLLGEAAFTAQVQWLGAFWDARSGELGPVVDLDVRHPKEEVLERLSMPGRIDRAGLYMPNVNTGYGGCGSCSLKRSCPVGSRIGTGEVKL